MTHIDSVRWGDSDSFSPPVGTSTLTSKMLCYATAPKGGRPIAWAFLMSAIAQFATGEVNDFTFTFNLTIGCGAATIPFPQKFQIQHPTFPPITQLITLPASNIMCNVTLFSPLGTLAGNTFQVAAMAAPLMDPSAMAEMLSLMRGEHGDARQPGDDMHGHPFIEEGLRLHHNR